MSADIEIGNDVTMEYLVSNKMMKFEVMTYLSFLSMVTGRIKLTDSPFSKQNFARQKNNEELGVCTDIINVQILVCKKVMVS